MDIIPPFVPESRDGGYRVTPQERVDRLWLTNPFLDIVQPTTPVVVPRAVHGSKAGSSIDIRPAFFVFELVYPGSGDMLEDNFLQSMIVDKWIYMAHIPGRRFLAEIHAVDASTWKYREKPTPEDQPRNPPLDKVAPTGLLFRFPYFHLSSVQVGDDLSAFGFFLSPVRLSRKGMEKLLDSRYNMDDFFVRPRWAGSNEAVTFVPDPFRWAADAHDQYYIPALSAWKTWVGDPERQAQNFIAGVLKGWIDEGDHARVKGELAIQPDDHMRGYAFNEENYYRAPAERAAAYVSSCADSIEHFAVEESCKENGGQDLSTAFQQWAVICEAITQTRPGQEFAAQLVSNKDRLPARYIFSEEPPSNELQFSAWRYAWLAAIAIFVELVPAAAAKIDPTAAWDLVQKYLERLNLEKPLTGHYLEIYHNLSKNRPPWAGPRKIRPKLVKKYLRLYMRAEAARPPSSIDEIKDSADKLHKNHAGHFHHVAYAITGVFEIVNMCLAVKSYLEANPEDKHERLFKVAIASSHMTEFVSTTMKELSEKAVGRRIWGALGGAAGSICGALEMMEHVQEFADEGIGRNDYSASVGHAIAAAGGAASALGGGMMLLAALTDGAVFAEVVGVGGLVAGPVGAVVAGIGAVLIVTGVILAEILKSNDYQLFSRACFLGVDHKTDTRYYPWTSVGIPNSAVKEATAVTELISNFRVEVLGGGDPHTRQADGDFMSWIEITPGYMDHSTYFEIEMEQKYGAGYHSDTFTAQFKIYENTDEPQFISGNLIPHLERIEIAREGDNSIQKFRFPLSPLSVQNEQGAVLFENYPRRAYINYSRVRIRLTTRNMVIPPEKKVQIDTRLDNEVVNSLNVWKWV
jgi:hypothetical protein